MMGKQSLPDALCCCKEKQVVNDCEMPFSIILVIVDPETNPPEQEELITAAAQLFYHLYADVYHVPQL
jgi:hypothetical protein